MIDILFQNPCLSCSAYQEGRHCGTWISDCDIFVDILILDEFLNEMGWDEEYLKGYIKFSDFSLQLST